MIAQRINRHFRHAHLWLPGYFLNRITSGSEVDSSLPKHIFLCICDHFEPTAEGADRTKALQRVKKWVEKYPEIAKKYHDSNGRIPKYTFFYPLEEYCSQEMQLLAELCHQGYGEVEIHLHHDNDTAENLRNSLQKFKNLMFSQYGLLSKDKKTDEIRYAFIHGNWALNNSGPDGRFCGINNETKVLYETGCYADFTLPSAPSETQTQKVNSLYYAADCSPMPKAHNWGTDVKSGHNNGHGLLLIQGPLMLDWKRKKFGIFPRIENSSIDYNNPVTAHRIKLWIDANIHVKGKANWIFVKVHTHGCADKNIESLLNRDLDFLFSYLSENCNDKKSFFLHFVSAREIYNIIKALEREEVSDNSDIDKYLDYELYFGNNH